METKYKYIEYLDSTGVISKNIPEECITECSAHGDVTQAVIHWSKELGFTAPVNETRAYLKTFGAWDKAELANHDDNLERLLWCVCCDLKEERNSDAD